jgi:hypothetical protein
VVCFFVVRAVKEEAVSFVKLPLAGTVRILYSQNPLSGFDIIADDAV